MAVNGIDVASYQSTAYDTTGVDFVFIKATEGTSYVNPKQDAQAAHARAVGCVVGFYHFLHPGNVAAQASYFVAKCASQAGDILVCDWEPTSSGTPSNADKDAFIRAVKQLRPDHKVVLYCDVARWTGVDKTSYAGDGLWIADPNHPAGQPGIKAPWLFHQYGIRGTDRDVANFPSRAALAAWAGSTEEDPMAGITKQDIHDAVWRIDDITAGSTEKNPANKTWQPDTYLKGTFENTVRLLAQESAQTAAIAKLASLVGSGVDTATVVAAVQQAVADAVVHVSVDVTGPNN